MLLLQHCDVIENNTIDDSAAIALVEKFELLMNIYEWTRHVQDKKLPEPPPPPPKKKQKKKNKQNSGLHRGMRDNAPERYWLRP